jgi:hypothetical protein
MTADLVAFLRARLDDDEQTAHAATLGPWEWTPEEDVWGHCGPALIRAGFDGEGDRELVEVLSGWGHDAWGMHVSDNDAAHIARHDPARVLADVEAKRQLLDDYEQVMDTRRAHPNDPASAGALLALHKAIKRLALPYADHPDYKESGAHEEWKDRTDPGTVDEAPDGSRRTA